jgi:Tol biopolymer transport system component
MRYWLQWSKRIASITLFSLWLYGCSSGSASTGRFVFSFYTFPDDDTPTGSYDIYAIDYSGKNLVQLTAYPTNEVEPDLSADGSKIVFADDTSSLYVMNADGNNVQPMTLPDRPFGKIVDLAWSPDGNSLAFMAQVGQAWTIFRVNADGSGLAALTPDSMDSFYPNWSPDGTQIVFSAELENGRDIVIMNADGSNMYQITHGQAGSRPVWSPDGSTIAFTAEDQIAVIKPDGSEMKVLTDRDEIPDRLAWSTDSKRIIFSAALPGEQFGKLYNINRSGSGRKVLFDFISLVPESRRP